MSWEVWKQAGQWRDWEHVCGGRRGDVEGDEDGDGEGLGEVEREEERDVFVSRRVVRAVSFWSSGRKSVPGPRRVVASFQCLCRVGGSDGVCGLHSSFVNKFENPHGRFPVRGSFDFADDCCCVAPRTTLTSNPWSKKFSSTCHRGTSNSVVGLVARMVSQ